MIEELPRLSSLPLAKQSILSIISHNILADIAINEQCSWEAGLPDPPTFLREPFKHTIKPLGAAGHDDLYEMNTQSGSQASVESSFTVKRLTMRLVGWI
jgi:hypothetical protein